MHSSESGPPAAASGPALVLQLGRLIVRARSPPPAAASVAATPHRRLLAAKLLAAAGPSTSQVLTQPKPDCDERPGVEAQLSSHVQALWNNHVPICIEVLLAPDCVECYTAAARQCEARPRPGRSAALLLERWTMVPQDNTSSSGPGSSNPQWLLNAVRSQLHFSQLAAWRATLQPGLANVARRKLSRENCNYKKVEANCDEDELAEEKRSLNVVYSIRLLGDGQAEFVRPPTAHAFPVADIGNNIALKVLLECLPRIDEVPTVACNCPKRRTSKEMPPTTHEDLTGKLSDLTIGTRSVYPSDHAINSNIGTSARRLSIVSNAASTEYLYTTDDKEKMLDDRMHTPCSESGKHKCNYDEESDGKDNIKTVDQEPKKLDERRLKEIAKYKRRLRKEIKLKKLCDSTSSEGEVHQRAKETHTSIPILQAARFDRFRAIGCYRNQTYLTLPASRIESKSPFVESISIPPAEYKKSNTVATQTEDLTCPCGSPIQMRCEDCSQQRLVRSEANYDLAGLDGEKSNGARRKCEEDVKTLKKHKCDNFSGNTQCDNVDNSVNEFIKRPKMQRTSERIDRLVADRSSRKDMEDLNLNVDDSVFSTPKESKRQKTYSISEDDYVMYEKCLYGTFDNCENETMDSPKEEDQTGFQFPEGKKGPDNQVPSPSEMDRFRWRFDSAASMVFHTKTGLPLTSSPAPLRRGKNCFDFDDSINGISGIKSALFHPGAAPTSPLASPPSGPPPKAKPTPTPKLRLGPSAGLLGSFEESALQGRLEPVATVAGFAAEIGASGAFCPPHRRLPVTVFFYGTTHASYMGHINLAGAGYRVARSGTVQVSLFNPHGTLVKMFVVLYDLTGMPPRARTFLRQRTLYLPAGAAPPPPQHTHKWLRYLIHLRFMTSKSGKLYLHTDIRIIVSRKADIDTATAHVFRPLVAPASTDETPTKPDKILTDSGKILTSSGKILTSSDKTLTNSDRHRPNRVFGGSSEYDSERKSNIYEIGYENQDGVSYELRSFTYAPENPKYSPR